MKKIILLSFVLGVYAMQASASDVDGDYSGTSGYDASYHGLIVDQLSIEQSTNHDADTNHYQDDTPWIGTTHQTKPEEASHRMPFDDFGYDEE